MKSPAMARKKPTGDDCAPFGAGEQPQAEATKQEEADFGALVLAQAQEQGSAMQAAVLEKLRDTLHKQEEEK